MMKYKMLVVEDNTFTANMLSVLFEGLGFEVKTIENGMEVLPYMKNNHVDLMILDLELPGMTGDKIYGAIRENPGLKSIPIIPFTAHRDTKSANTLPVNLIWAEYAKSGKIPDIVFKSVDSGEVKDVNQELVDEIAWNLMRSNKEITKEMAEYYLKTRGMNPEDLMKKG
ncbi:hypothetical protein BVX98_05120 [bacterium F11]|nr:hypothetical protein BVX98_05120 [bacterium F11]